MDVSKIQQIMINLSMNETRGEINSFEDDKNIQFIHLSF